MKSISSSKTKAQIIEAYKQLAKEFEAERAANSKLQKELAEKDKTVQAAKI